MTADTGIDRMASLSDAILPARERTDRIRPILIVRCHFSTLPEIRYNQENSETGRDMAVPDDDLTELSEGGNLSYSCLKMPRMFS